MNRQFGLRAGNKKKKIIIKLDSSTIKKNCDSISNTLLS